MSPLELMTSALLLVGAVFFAGGTLVLLRFPDSLSRLHALAKADNLGLGFVVAGLIVQAGSVAVALKVVLIWIVAMVASASASASYLIARLTIAPPGRGSPPRSRRRNRVAGVTRPWVFHRQDAGIREATRSAWPNSRRQVEGIER